MSAAAAVPIARRQGEWAALAERLYGESVAGVVGARGWRDLSPDARLRWFQRAEGWDAGRRRYEREWGDLPGLPPWEELDPAVRERWIAEAVRYPGRVA